MTLQTVSAAGLAWLTVQKFPRWIEDNEPGLHQNCIFQPIWVNSLWLIQLVSDYSTMRTSLYSTHLQVHRCRQD